MGKIKLYRSLEVAKRANPGYKFLRLGRRVVAVESLEEWSKAKRALLRDQKRKTITHIIRKNLYQL